MKSVDQLIAETLVREGGGKFTNRKADYGGPTKWGITQATLSAVLGHTATIDDVRNLSRDDAVRIYHTVFYLDAGIPRWPAPVQPLGFDMFVQHKPRTVGRIVQQVLCAAGWPLVVDGKLGPKSYAAMAEAQAAMGELLGDALCDERAAYYLYLVQQDATQAENIDGWLRRAAEFRTAEPTWLPTRFRRGSAAPAPEVVPTREIRVPVPASKPAEAAPVPSPPAIPSPWYVRLLEWLAFVLQPKGA